MNYLLELLNQIPYSSSTGIHISPLSCVGLYVCIISFAIALERGNKRALYLGLFSLLFLGLHQAHTLLAIQQEKILRVYHVYQSSAIELQDGLDAYHYFDVALLNNEGSLNYSIRPNWWANHIRHHVFDSIQSPIRSLSFANKTILVIDAAYTPKDSVLHSDYLIVRHHDKLNLQNLSKEIVAKKYIFDSSNKANQYKYWKKDCEDLNLNCYFVSEEHAYEEKLNE